MQCVFSPLAELDLEEIGDYIARDKPACLKSATYHYTNQ